MQQFEHIAPSFDTWTIIFLIAGIQGLLLAGIFFFNPKNTRTANWLLGSVMLLFGLTLIEYVGYWTNYRYVYPHTIAVTTTFPLLLGPLFFFYRRHVVHGTKIHWKEAWHFFPFIGMAVQLFPFYFQGAEAKLMALAGNGEAFPWRAWIQIVHMSIYATLMVLATKRDFKDQKALYFARPEAIQTWLHTVSLLFAIFIGSFASYYVLVNFSFFNVEWDYMISFAMSASIFAVGILGYRKPVVMQGAPKREEVPVKYEHSTLTPSLSNELYEQLIMLMETQAPHLNSRLKLKDLANELSISTHDLSQVINEQTPFNFSDFVNSYRVSEAKRLLTLRDYESETLINIAYEVGFNNKTSFYNAFKKLEGVSPSEYRKHLRREKEQSRDHKMN